LQSRSIKVGSREEIMEALQVINLTKHYENVRAVDGISFNVKKGKICGILGPNGSGKTTTIKCISNLIIPDSGKIRVLGEDNKKSLNNIAAVFEGTRNLYWRLTPRENLRYFAGIRGLGGRELEKEINILLDRFNLTDKKDVVVNNLSRGMQQKVAIAMTLICDTEIILLDEPTLGLDVQSHLDIKNILIDVSYELDKTILISTHDMKLVQDICEDVVILSNGKIVAKDSIEKLFDMFKTMTYEIVLTECLSEEKKSSLMKLNRAFYIINNGSKLETDILNEKDIYRIVDDLKNLDIFIKEIKQKEQNFERVFLSLTAGEVD
jgi:ABC-2 type transport system ATP-binding protein